MMFAHAEKELPEDAEQLKDARDILEPREPEGGGACWQSILRTIWRPHDRVPILWVGISGPQRALRVRLVRKMGCVASVSLPRQDACRNDERVD